MNIRPRRNYSPKEKKSLISKWELSNLKKEAFCLQEGISTSSLRRWKEECREPEVSKAPFLQIYPPSQTAENLFIEVCLPGGTNVRLPSSLEEGKLKSILSSITGQL